MTLINFEFSCRLTIFFFSSFSYSFKFTVYNTYCLFESLSGLRSWNMTLVITTCAQFNNLYHFAFYLSFIRCLNFCFLNASFKFYIRTFGSIILHFFFLSLDPTFLFKIVIFLNVIVDRGNLEDWVLVLFIKLVVFISSNVLVFR